MYITKENVETKTQDWSKICETCDTLVSKQAIRAVRVALMSLGMTFSFFFLKSRILLLLKIIVKTQWNYTGVILGRILLTNGQKEKWTRAYWEKVNQITQASLAGNFNSFKLWYCPHPRVVKYIWSFRQIFFFSEKKKDWKRTVSKSCVESAGRWIWEGIGGS